MPTATQDANLQRSEPPPTLNFLSNLFIGVIPMVVIAFLVILSPEVNLRVEVAIVWLICTALFVLADLLAGDIRLRDWAGYLNLVSMVAWLCVGLPLALAVIVVGTGAAAIIRFRFSSLLRLRPLVQSDILKHTVVRILISSSGVLIAAVIYSVLNGVIPLRQIKQQDALPLLTAILVGFITTQITGLILTRLVFQVSSQPIWSLEKRDQWLSELSLLPLIVTLPLVLYGAGLGVFTVIMSVVAAHAVRYRQIDLAAGETRALYQRSTDLVQKLSLVNRSVQNAMFNVDQAEATKTACQTAIVITQASKAAIFLIDREQEKLYLADEIGFTPAHREAGRDVPYYPEMFPTSPRVVNDTERANPELRAFAQRNGFRAFVEMPLRSGNVILGYLNVYDEQPHTYTKTELDLLEILANQLTAALDNAQLLRALEVHAFEMTHLVHLSRISTSTLDLAKLAADISNMLRQMTGMDWVMLGLLDGERMQVMGMLGGPNEQAETPTALMPQLPEIRRMVSDTYPQQLTIQDSDPGRSEPLQSFMTLHRLKSLTLSPMVAHEKLFGVIFLGTHQEHVLSNREEQLLETATNQVSTQLYNVLVYKETHDALNSQLQQLALIEDIVQQISSSHDFNQIINGVFEAAIKTTRADAVAFALLTEADDLWVIEQHYQTGVPQRRYTVQSIDQGITGHVARTGQIALVDNNLENPHYIPLADYTYRSSLAVPLMKDGVTIGVLDVESKQPAAFTRDEANFLKNLGGHAIISIENARLLEELQYQIATLTSLRELSLTLSTAVDTDAVAKAMLRTALDVTHGDYAALFHYDPALGQLIPLVGTERDHSASTPAESKVLVNVALQAAMAGQTQVIEDMLLTFPDELPENVNFNSLVAVPIRRGRGVNEVLCVAFQEHQYFEARDLNTLNLLAIQGAGHLENALLHERIRDGNNRMRAILDSTRDGIILLDYGGRLIEVNPSAQRLIGLNLAEHIGEPLVDVLLQYSEGAEEGQAGYSREELTKLARIQRLQPEGITRREFSRTIQPNQTIFVEEIGSSVIDEENHVVGRLLVLRDITEEKQIEAEREQITSMAVHDLRSPLASIISALKIAQDTMDAPDSASILRQTMQVSITSAEKLMNVVNSLLDIRRGRSMSLERSDTSIEELVEMARLTLLASIEKANLHVHMDIPPNMPLVNVDPDKMRRVLINLLDNAIRYTPAGKEIMICVSHDTARGKLVVKVADSGIGIPKAARERIFEQFWQVKENQPLRGSKGAGIGLAFCARVLEAHGERIWVADEGPLPGACFVFTLPVSH
jgi:PAS domain S-box-containing protein